MNQLTVRQQRSADKAAIRKEKKRLYSIERRNKFSNDDREKERLRIKTFRELQRSKNFTDKVNRLQNAYNSIKNIRLGTAQLELTAEGSISYPDEATGQLDWDQTPEQCVVTEAVPDQIQLSDNPLPSLFATPSTIKRAVRQNDGTVRYYEIGKGLATSKFIKKGEDVVQFIGNLEPNNLLVEAHKPYCIYIKQGYSLDCYQSCKDERCLASLSNCPNKCVVFQDGQPCQDAKANAAVVVTHATGCARLVATRNIHMYEEVLWHYGRGYKYPIY